MAGTAIVFSIKDLRGGNYAGVIIQICDQIRNIVTDLDRLRTAIDGTNSALAADSDVTNLDDDYASSANGLLVDVAGDMIASNITIDTTV